VLSGPAVSLSIPAKVFAGYVALLLTFGAVSGFTVWQIRELGERANALYETLVPLPSAVAEMRSELRSLDLVTEQSEPAALRRTVHLARRVHPTLDRLNRAFLRAEERLLEPRVPGAEALQIHLAELRSAERALARAVTAFFDDVEAGRDPARRELRRQLAALGRALDRFDARLQKTLDGAVVTFGEEEQSATWAAIVLATVAMFIGALITFTASRLLRPLRSLRAAVERIAEGDYGDAPVPEGGSGELRALAVEFNRMAGAIARRDAQLSAQQKELLDRERLATVGRMSAQITHELRNPLSSIGLNSELLLEELEPGAELDRTAARSLLESIIREVDRLREITEEYLRFARLPRPERVPVNLNHAVEELLEFLRGEMTQAGVRTRLDPDPAAHPALVDPNQLRAALLNLLRNAREATGEGGHVVVRVRSLGGSATVEVVDDGPGLSPEAREHLFEPFFSTKPQGTGLGLSMVRRIVEAQEGTISFATPGTRGAIARLTLPLADAEPGVRV
jgi:two-component system, NtrC family, sensor kinase